jgi:DNA primase
MGAAHEVVPEAAPNPADLGPPESFLPLFEEPGRSALVTEDARAYLLARGLGPAKWGAAGIGACTSGLYAGRVVVPVLAPSGEWLGFVGRAWTKKADMPYRNARGMKRVDLLYNEATLGAASDDPVIVVEGVFDALHVWPDGVAVLGKPSAGQVAKLACCRRPIAVVLDGDAWAEGEALSLKLRLSGQRAGFVRLPPKIDPDEIPLEEIRAAARECIR